jgi:hypothetical protein
MKWIHYAIVNNSSIILHHHIHIYHINETHTLHISTISYLSSQNLAEHL